MDFSAFGESEAEGPPPPFTADFSAFGDDEPAATEASPDPAPKFAVDFSAFGDGEAEGPPPPFTADFSAFGDDTAASPDAADGEAEFATLSGASLPVAEAFTLLTGEEDDTAMPEVEILPPAPKNPAAPKRRRAPKAPPVTLASDEFETLVTPAPDAATAQTDDAPPEPAPPQGKPKLDFSAFAAFDDLPDSDDPPQP